MRRSAPARSAVTLGWRALLPLLAAMACGHSAPYTWVQRLPREQDAVALNISPGDIVDVRVFGQDNLSAKGQVRPDGSLTLPLLGQVGVAGQRPEDVAKLLKQRFTQYVVSPDVTVVIEKSQVTVAMIGEIKAVGIVELESPANVLQALAKAGGMTEFADTDAIYVLRPLGGGNTRRIRFSYESLVAAEAAAIGFHLRSGDVVVVE